MERVTAKGLSSGVFIPTNTKLVLNCKFFNFSGIVWRGEGGVKCVRVKMVPPLEVQRTVKHCNALQESWSRSRGVWKKIESLCVLKWEFQASVLDWKQLVVLIGGQRQPSDCQLCVLANKSNSRRTEKQSKNKERKI